MKTFNLYLNFTELASGEAVDVYALPGRRYNWPPKLDAPLTVTGALTRFDIRRDYCMVSIIPATATPNIAITFGYEYPDDYRIVVTGPRGTLLWSADVGGQKGSVGISPQGGVVKLNAPAGSGDAEIEHIHARRTELLKAIPSE
jgi:hypothetical protein